MEPQDGEKMLKTLEKNLSKKLGKDSPVFKAVMPNIGELSEWLAEGDFINRDLAKGDFVKLNALISNKILAKT